MDLKTIFPVWDQLTPKQQEYLAGNAAVRRVEKGRILHQGSTDCIGLLLIQKGQLRAYLMSEEGRQITIYRLFDLDICLFSASCMMNSLQFDVFIEAEKDTELWVIPAEVYKKVMEESAPLSNYTNEIMAARFSDVMWLMEQVMWRSFDKRLAEFLLEEAALEGTMTLKLTHETIGNHLGNPREVVTRMLRYFQNEGMVRLSRGSIEITDPAALREICRE